MFLAFIWYAYCACKSKIQIFQIIVLLKTKEFLCKTNGPKGSLTKKLWKKGWFSIMLRVDKDASFHIRPFLFDLYEIWQWIRIIKRNVPLWSPPPPYRSTKKPTLIRVKQPLWSESPFFYRSKSSCICNSTNGLDEMHQLCWIKKPLMSPYYIWLWNLIKLINC